MAQISRETFQFLEEIQVNNNREWFAQNKERYQQIQSELREFGEALLQGAMAFDASLRDEPKPYLFRIHRDARFAKGRPYKGNLGLLLVRGGRAAMHLRAGYYLHLEPGGCFLAGGAYMPEKPWLHSIREALAEDAKPFRKIISSEAFRTLFSFGGDALKSAPKGTPKDHPNIDLLRQKDFMALHPLSDKEVLAQDFLPKLLEACRALQPFDAYLNGLAEKNLRTSGR